MHASAAAVVSPAQSSIDAPEAVATPLASGLAYNLAGHGVVSRLLARDQPRRALILHDQDDQANPATTYAMTWYEHATPSRVLGWFASGPMDVYGLPVTCNSVDLTNAVAGTPQYPLDRTRTPWLDGFGDPQYNGTVYDTSANAGDGTKLGVRASFVPGRFQELRTDPGTPIDDQQVLYNYVLEPSSTNDDWVTDQLRVVVLFHRPAVDGSGVEPVNGCINFEFGRARTGGANTSTGDIVESGPENAINSYEFTVAADADPSKLPTITAMMATGDGFASMGCRTIPVGCLLESKTAFDDGDAGLVLMAFGNPYTDSYDLSLDSAGKGLNPAVYWPTISAAVGDIDVVVIRTGGWLSNGFANYSGIDNYGTLTDTSHPETAPYGEYRAEFSESLVDQVNVTRIGVGDTNAQIPVLMVLSHWAGGGVSIAEAELILATQWRSLKWAIDNPVNDHPYHANSDQVWLRNCAAVNPWHDVTPTQILTGQGAAKYIRRNGTALKGTWAAGTNYVAGDVIFRAQAADLLRGNWGWWVCKAGGAHLSAGAGVNGPPDDAAQTRWETVDFALNDAGKLREVQAIWAAITAAAAVVGA